MLKPSAYYAILIHELYAVQVVLSRIETWTRSKWRDPFHHSQHNDFADAVLRCLMCFTSKQVITGSQSRLHLFESVSVHFITVNHCISSLNVTYSVFNFPLPRSCEPVLCLRPCWETRPHCLKQKGGQPLKHRRWTEIFSISNTRWKDHSDLSFRRTLSIKADMKTQNAWHWRGQCEKSAKS